MDKVISADGTEIAYVRTGSGPTVILVAGAFGDRTTTEALGDALAGDFTAISYDRRGRGDSGDARPHDVQREIKDLDALIRANGGHAFLHGNSSGAALCLRTAAAGVPVDAVSGLEPPYRVGPDAPLVPADYAARLAEFAEKDQRDEAVEYFMTQAVGQPQEAVDAMRQMPMWAGLAAVAPTLLYDALALGGSDHSLPTDLLATIAVPVLTVYSEASPAWLTAGASGVAAAVATGEVVGRPGDFHDVPVETLAPLLTAFFLR